MKKILVHILLLLSFLPAIAQKQQDALLWTSISVEKKINKRFSVTLLNQYSFNQNFRELGFFFFDLGLNYKVGKNVMISGNYRLAESRNLDNQYDTRQIIYGEATFSKGFGKFSFQWRTRFQTQFYGFRFADNPKPNKNLWRNKLTIKYHINRKYSIFVSGEQFFRFDGINDIQSWRFGGGVNYNVNIKHRIDLYYLNQIQVNQHDPRTDFIFGVTYYFKF